VRVIDGVGLDKVIFEGAEPAVFEWYVKNYGNEVKLFVDHSKSCSPKRCGRRAALENKGFSETRAGVESPQSAHGDLLLGHRPMPASGSGGET
jgi:hypothetical protein